MKVSYKKSFSVFEVSLVPQDSAWYLAGIDKIYVEWINLK